MREQHFLLLLFSGVLSFGTLCTALNGITQQERTETNDSTSDFLQCVGVPPDPGAGEQQILNLKALIDALLDVIVFIDSGLNGVPLLNVSTGLSINSTALLQNDDIIRAWLQIRLSPLSSISQNFLTCLGYNNFSCQTYQTIVQELSQQFSSLDSQKQQWIYTYFMQPFLSGNTPAGCVLPGDTTDEWLNKNFGSFSVLAQLRVLSSINGDFNGLDALHLLSQEQKAELILYPEIGGLNNESLTVVLSSLLSSLTPSGGDVNSTNGAMWTTGYPVMYSPTPQDPFTQTLNGFMTAFRPVRSFVREFASLTHQQDLSNMRSATLIQALLNWTLAELAAPYKNISSTQQMSQTAFDPTDVNSWFTHIVVPVLNRYLPNDIPHELTAIFHNVFYMENSVNKAQDICSVSLDGICAVANIMEHVAKILHCAAKTNLTLTEETVTSLMLHLTSNLNTLLNQLTNTNFSSEDSPFRNIINKIHDPEHSDLTDEAFITLWFHIKLKPVLPNLTPEYLQCLSAKPFSCQTFQKLVWLLDNNMFLLGENRTYLVYKDFIFPFLLRQNSTGACMANNSFDWIVMNLGGFSQFATVQEMYLLNPQFDALEAFDALTLNQIAELIVVDLPQLPDKKQLIDIVFSKILKSMMRQQLPQLILLISAKNTMNMNCLIYREMFSWLHFEFLSAKPETEAVILSSINSLMTATPAACVSYSSECNITSVNESMVCNGVNSSALMEYLKAPHNGSQLCSFNITQYACAQLTDLSAEDLVTVLCNLHGNGTVSEETWNLFLKTVNPILGPALDLFTNMTLPLSRPLGIFLDMIGEVTLSSVSPSSFTNNSFVELWFGKRLHPFLHYASQNFLSCISQYNFSCQTFQSVVNILNQQFDVMSNETQMCVYVYFIYTFLSSNRTAGCSLGVQSSDWLSKNFGAFSQFATISELQNLNPTFSVLDILGSLSLAQLVEVCASPHLISTAAQVTQVVNYVPDAQLGSFFSTLATMLTVDGVSLVPEVSKSFLQQVFVRVNLSDPTMSDSEVEQWINIRLKPFISTIQSSQVPVYFSMITHRSCNISHQGVELLNSARSSFTPDVLQIIYNELLIALRDPTGLMTCYTGQSYYTFLHSYFMGFQFPPLSTFLSLIPSDRMSQLLNSISPAELSKYLNQNGTVDNQTKLCELFNSYNQTHKYLQSEPILSSALASQTLECVWPRAVNASSQADVDQWFNVALVQYLPYLSYQMISSTQKDLASCLAFRKFVSVMGSYNFTQANFTKTDIYHTIQSYLSTENPPKCYSPKDPELNSTAWFYQYIGDFISFLTVDDLQQFGGIVLEQFTPNEQNLQLFTKNNVSQDVNTVYVNMLFDFVPDFSITALPTQLWCDAPASAFSNLSQNDAENIAKALLEQCALIDSTVFAALAANVDVLTPNSISALGNSITGLSVGQIERSNPSYLRAALSFLSSVGGWSQSQAMTIVELMLSAGVFKITTAESLVELGTLLMGVPSTMFTNVAAASLLSALQSQTFLSNVLTTPTTTQEIIVKQIISVNSTPDTVVQNVPTNLAPLIPRTYVLDLSQQTATTLNQKQWNPNQAMLFFNTVADGFSDADNISLQVLQGFTCTRVQRYDNVKVKNLIRGCRRRGNRKVILQESQLTCMYNYIKSDTVTVFTDYPAEMLLYYNLSQVQPSMCQAYYSALGEANFNVFSSTLAFKRDILFNNALQCLAVLGFSVNQTQLDVLGQMVCLFNSSYILNSDPYVLEKLKLCAALTTEQSSAVENILLSGNTTYGASNSWNQTTLNNLGILPLYLTSNFWAYFTKKEKVDFLRVFIPKMKSSGQSRQSISTLITETGKVSKTRESYLFRFRRDTTCIAGVITQIQLSDASFPFGYDVNQFNACLSVQTLKDNLGSITDKATDSNYQQVILDKLNQAYPAGISDTVLHELGSASRSATTSDISKWNVTKIDTLSALMRPYDGAWSPEQVRAIISRYMSGNRTLGYLELNALGGTNLCALDTSLLKTISSASIQFADPLSVSTCSVEQMQVLFSIAQLAFSDQTLSKSTKSSNTMSQNSYQLIRSYLGGADVPYVLTLSMSNISMDLLTFITLNQNVINNLTVSEVQGLIGRNLPDMKLYENNTVVNSWIKQQLQSDLDKLGIGLTGGRASPTVTTANVNAAVTTANANANASTSASNNATTTKPTGAGSSISASSGLQKLLLLLAVTTATLQLTH